MPDNPYARSRASIHATKKLLAESRTQGYKQTNNVIDAIYGNLSTTERGLGRQLGAAQSRQLSAIQRLQDNANARNTALSRKAVSGVRNKYGSAIAGGTDFSAVKAQAKAGAVAGAGSTRAATQLAAGNTAAVQIAKQGALQAQAGAKYEASQALAARTKEDAQTIAQQQMALAQMRLQNALDLQNYKKKALFSKKLEDQSTDTSLNGITSTSTQLAGASADMRKYLVDHPEATASDLVTAVAPNYPVAGSDPNFTAAMQMIATNVKSSVDSNGQTLSGYSATDEANDVYGVVSRFYAPPKRMGDAVLSTISSALPTFYAPTPPKVETGAYAPYGGDAAVLWQGIQDTGLEVISGGSEPTTTYNVGG